MLRNTDDEANYLLDRCSAILAKRYETMLDHHTISTTVDERPPSPPKQCCFCFYVEMYLQHSPVCDIQT